MKLFLISAYDYWTPSVKTAFVVRAKNGSQAFNAAYTALLPQMGTASVIRMKEIKGGAQ